MNRIIAVLIVALLLIPTTSIYAAAPTPNIVSGTAQEVGSFLIPDRPGVVWLWGAPNTDHKNGDVLPAGRYRVLQKQDVWSQIDFSGRTPWVFTGNNPGLHEETVGGTPVPTIAPTASKPGWIEMNQPFDVGGFTFVVKDVYRNKAVYEWGDKAIIAKGRYAIARFEATSHVPYSVDFTDRVSVIFTDTHGKVYDASYTPLSVARAAQLAAPRLFGDGTTVWETMEPTYVNFPMIHTEDVPENTPALFLEFISQSTSEVEWVHLQPLTSEAQHRYEGEFINAPEKK
jgi:hypothetical protein